MSNLTAALIQQTYGPRREDNLEKVACALREARRAGAQLVALSELHGSLYFCQQEDPTWFDLAEPIPGPTTDFLSRQAKELGLVVVGSVFERRAAGLYHNTAVVLDTDGRLAGRYRKMHIPDDPGYYEKYYFTPGDLGFRPIETSLGFLGVLVCWDQWYPEAARLMALEGADVLIYPTAIGWDPRDEAAEKQRQLDAWIAIQRAHAIANGLPVLSVNRIGLETPAGPPGIQFWGHSMVVGCQGELLAQAGADNEETLIVTLNRARSESVRRAWPFLRDRRIDAYQGLLKRFADDPSVAGHSSA